MPDLFTYYANRFKWMILFVYLALATALNIFVPVFEAPDEYHHYFMVEYIASFARLPVASLESLPRQEPAQPPLYYLISAILLQPFDFDYADEPLNGNPFLIPGDFEATININAFTHSYEEKFPWRGRVLRVHWLRFFSTFLGAGALWCIGRAAAIVWPDQPAAAVVSMALVAFLPQFIFQTAAVSNDPAIIFFALPADVNILELDFGDGLVLRGSQILTPVVQPGGAVELLLYWEQTSPATTETLIIPEIWGQENKTVGWRGPAFHGAGLFPTTAWPVNQVVVEPVAIPIWLEGEVPAAGRVMVGVDRLDNPLEVGLVKLAGETLPPPQTSPRAVFGDQIALHSPPFHRPAGRGQTVQIDLTWEVLTDPPIAYTVLFHLGDPNFPPLATGDRPPLKGFYPTSMWAAGEVLHDQVELVIPVDLPPGRYPHNIGFYLPQTGERLPVSSPEPWVNNTLTIGWLMIE